MFLKKTLSLAAAVAALALTVSACSTPPVAGESASADDSHSILGLYHSPTPVGHPGTAQREWQAAQHWERLAADAVKGFVAARAKQGGNKRPIYVDPADQGMVFSKVFRKFLITQLLANDQSVSLTSNGADRIHVSVDQVFHKVAQYDPPFGILSGLAAGAAMANSIEGSTALGPIGVLTFETLMRTPYARSEALSEVVVTVSLVRDDLVLARVSAPYYVDNLEMAQYAQSTPAMPLSIKSSGERESAMRVRSFGVVSD